MSFPFALSADDMNTLDALELLPLRQAVHAAHAAQNVFACAGLLQALSRGDRYRILRHGCGGQILARNGLALAQAQEVLRQAYGRSITFGTPTAHRVIDHASAAVLVPIMGLRIDAPGGCRQELLQVLADRSVAPAELAAERDRIVLRTEAPLACLIGLERQVLQATAGAAHILCWLSRYSPAPSAQLDEVQQA